MGIANSLDVVQSQSKPFYVVYIAGGYPVKLLKNLSLVFPRNTDAPIGNPQDHLSCFFFNGDIDLRFPPVIL